MNNADELIKQIERSRKSYLELVGRYTEQEARWKPDADIWNMVEITEHLYWAEHGGIMGMWKTLQAIRDGRLKRNFDFEYKGMTIEQIIEKTWQPKEKVPDVAAPRYGGTIGFWSVSLQSLQEILESFGKTIQDDELRLEAHPHPISGPMDFHQRFEFLRFHIDRHHDQVSRLVAAM